MSEECKQLFTLIYAILGVFTALFIMVLDYCLKVKKNQLELIKRTVELEKKNGKEQKQIDQLKQELEQSTIAFNKEIEILKKTPRN